MRRDALVAIVLASAGGISPARSAGAEQAGAAAPGSTMSSSFPAPVVGADQLLVGTAVDFLTAAITAKTTGTEFRVSSVPLSAIDIKYVPVISEAAVVLSTDTSSSLSRVALSLPYNPFSLRAQRTAEVIDKQNTVYRCGARWDEFLKACNKGCETFGRMENKDQGKKLKDACTSQCGRDADREEGECNLRRLASEWQGINDSWTPLVALTAAADFYPYGNAANPQTPTTTTDLRWWGGLTLQGSFTFRKWERGQLDLWGSLRPRWRPSGAADSRMARYAGGGVTASWLVATFVNRAHLERYPDYASSGVLPGLALGASGQGSWCTDDDATCANGRARQLSLTPFLELRVTSQLQLRVAVPLNWYHSVAKDGTEAAPTFSLAGTIGPPG